MREKGPHARDQQIFSEFSIKMRVKKAKYIKDYTIQILFSDGSLKLVDFKPFLKNAKNLFVPLLDLEYFKNFSVDDTTICWPNEVDFCPDVLHEVGVDLELEKSKRKSVKIRQPVHAMSIKRKKNL